MKERKIKFRAWDIEKKEIRYDITGFECSLEGTISAVFLDGDVYPLQGYGQSAFIMEFTGLFDRAGKDVFEGDLLMGCTEDIWRVMWNPEDARFVLFLIEATKKFDGRLGGYYISMQGYRVKAMSIIGSVFENPELLEK